MLLFKNSDESKSQQGFGAIVFGLTAIINFLFAGWVLALD
jgi:hypothetical protein